MKVSEIQAVITQILDAGSCESPAFDATCLIEDIGGIGHGLVPLSSHVVLSKEKCDDLLAAAHKRAAGVPLQYILGNWDFLGLTLHVGEGVLIPRPETELLCETVAQDIRRIFGNSEVTIWDLCAGTGCVGLGIASLAPARSHRIVEFELSDQAFPYLKKNIAKYPMYSAKAVKADILTQFCDFSGPAHIIVSNPPYIPSGDLQGLQREVQHEPQMALDGGDGYRFYRAIADHWIPKLAKNGIAAVEVGFDQAKTVATLFANAGLSEVHCIKDFAGINRVVVGYVHD